MGQVRHYYLGVKEEGRILFDFVGNPFVDAAVAGLTALVGKENPRELTEEDLDGALLDLPRYFFKNDGNDVRSRWRGLSGMLYARNIAFFNPKPSKEKLIEYIARFREQIVPLSDSGSCIICGRRNAIISEKITWNQIPMTSSGGLVNFNSFMSPGFAACAGCVLLMLFLPFGILAPPSKNGTTPSIFLIPHGVNKKIMLWLAQDAVRYIKQRADVPVEDIRFFFPAGNEGVIPGSANVPEVAILRIFAYLVENYLVGSNQPLPPSHRTMDVYAIINTNQSAMVDIYRVPQPLFDFVTEALKHHRGELCEFLFGPNRKSEYGTMMAKRLVAGDYLLSRFINLRNRAILGSKDLAILYAKEVLNMKKDRIRTIQKLADEVWKYLKDSKKPKRELEILEKTRNNPAQLRAFFIRVLKAGYHILNLDEYSEVFTEEGTWKESLDLLLIELYSRNIQDPLWEKAPDEEEEEEPEEPDREYSEKEEEDEV